MKPIALLADEQLLLEKLGSFDAREFEHASQPLFECLNASYNITHSLLNREAIPPERLRYFFDADYNLGRRKISIKENLKRNQRSDESVYRNTAYLKYLHFFLYGADLPSTLIARLDAIYNDEFYDDDRVEKMIPIFRVYFNQSDILYQELATEAYKYALDLKMSRMNAKRLRDKLMKFR